MTVEFVTQPSVYVIGRLLPQSEAIEAFFADHGFSGEAVGVGAEGDAAVPSMQIPIEVGARNCYQSFDRGRPHSAHVRHLVSVGHGSTLEHCVWQVLLSGVSRSCGRELLRHRHLSPSELSQRYCDASRLRFVVPPKLLGDYEQWRGEVTEEYQLHLEGRRRFEKFWQHCEDAIAMYERLRPTGATKLDREAARSVLPECTETRIVFTGNARAYRGLFERRCHEAADAEIRRVCCVLFDLLAADCRDVFADYTKRPLPDGTFAVDTPHRGI